MLGSDYLALVYNYCHELLLATSDTIATVTHFDSFLLDQCLCIRSRLESLNGGLDLLRTAFVEISRLAVEVILRFDLVKGLRTPSEMASRM